MSFVFQPDWAKPEQKEAVPDAVMVRVCNSVEIRAQHRSVNKCRRTTLIVPLHFKLPERGEPQLDEFICIIENITRNYSSWARRYYFVMVGAA